MGGESSGEAASFGSVLGAAGQGHPDPDLDRGSKGGERVGEWGGEWEVSVRVSGRGGVKGSEEGSHGPAWSAEPTGPRGLLGRSPGGFLFLFCLFFSFVFPFFLLFPFLF